jgi:peptidoglycan/LPS O-acetylase OafA/YrhL
MNRRFDKDSELMIDALRGVAAMMVLLTHTFDLSVIDVFGWEMDRSPESWRWARASIGHGGYWVWCFFIISGLCIHQSIARSVATGTFSWRRYLLARVTRIYPLFLLGLSLAVVAWELHEDWGEGVDSAPWRQFIASLLSLQIITTPFPSFETSWSLSCEMIYYLAWPAMLLVMRGRVSTAIYACIAAACATLAVILFFWKGMHRFEHSAVVDGIWTLAVLFPVWVCGAWLAGNWPAVSAHITRRLWLGSIGLCILSECLLAEFKFTQYPGWMIHVTSWASVPGLLIFIAGARHARLSRFGRAEPVCRWLGQFSYPCYILHMQLLLILNHFLKPFLPELTGGNPMLGFVLLLVPLLGSLALIGPRLERALMRWRAGFLERNRALSAPAALDVTP